MGERKMTVIVCLDDRGGMTFNRRRQSQDRRVRERMVQMAQNGCLRMNAYSAGQFEEEYRPGLYVEEDFLEKGEPKDFCFAENCTLAPYEGKIERLIVFRWNRVYPNDRKLDLSLEGETWKVTETEEFAGFSHEKITMEVYTK